MTDPRIKWLALGLAVVGIAVLLVIAAASIGGPLLSFALVAAFFVLLLPLAAYFILRRGRTEEH